MISLIYINYFTNYFFCSNIYTEKIINWWNNRIYTYLLFHLDMTEFWQHIFYLEKSYKTRTGCLWILTFLQSGKLAVWTQLFQPIKYAYFWIDEANFKDWLSSKYISFGKQHIAALSSTFFSYFPLEPLHWTVLWRLADYCRTDGSPHQILSAGFSAFLLQIKTQSGIIFRNVLLFRGSFLWVNRDPPNPLQQLTNTLSDPVFVSHHSTWWGRIVINLLSPILLLDLPLLMSCWSDLGNIRCFVLKCVKHEETINIPAPPAALKHTVAYCFYICGIIFCPFSVLNIIFPSITLFLYTPASWVRDVKKWHGQCNVLKKKRKKKQQTETPIWHFSC